MRPILALGLAGALVAIPAVRSARAAETCYRLPFSNPNLADGWGSTCCGRTNPHRGVDFPQKTGTPIPSVADGIVRLKTSTSCLGYVVVIEHPDGMFSGYAHMVGPSPLATGTPVKIGQIIGSVGNTGTCTTGPHLHLTIAPTLNGYAYGTTVDPYKYIKARESCNRAPRGALDEVSCNAIRGWAQDPDAPTSAIDVHVYVGGPAGDPKAFGIPLRADVHRPDLCTAIGSCNHGFSTKLPLSFFDGVERTVFAYAIDSKGGTNPQLGSKPLRCDAPGVPPLPNGVVRRHVPSAEVLAAWKLRTVDVATLADATLDALPKGPNVTEKPSLVKMGGDSKVWLREHHTLRYVPSPAVMSAWRFETSAIETAKPEELADDLRGADWTSTPFLAKGTGPEVYLLDAPPALWAELVEDDVPASVAPGSITPVTFRFKNRGSMPWRAGTVHLAPTPRDVASPLCDASWPSCTRAAAFTDDVLPGGEARVTFLVKAGDAEGTVDACFNLVTGSHWFSDPGANGPADDAVCRKLRVTSSPETRRADDASATADDAALEGGCACRAGASRATSLSLLALAGAFVAMTRRRPR